MLRPHAGPVFALAAPARPLAVSGSGGPLLVSGSWDGSTAEFGRAGCAAIPPGHLGHYHRAMLLAVKPDARPTRRADGERWAAAAHGSPVLAVAALELGGRTAIGRFDGAIGVHGGFGGEQRLAGRAAARTSHHTTSPPRVNLTSEVGLRPWRAAGL